MGTGPEPAQIATAVSRTYYASAVGIALRDAEAGDAGALAGEAARQRAQLAELVTAIDGPLPANDRKKLITLCTLDVHARDVVAGLAARKGRFTGLLQVGVPAALLCPPHDPSLRRPRYATAEIEHGCEYVGNVGTLCVTPLTDRCYITLAQARKLIRAARRPAPPAPAKRRRPKTWPAPWACSATCLIVPPRWTHAALGATSAAWPPAGRLGLL